LAQQQNAAPQWLVSRKEVYEMAAVGEKFKCELCGNVIEVVEEGGNPEIHCCGQPMTKL